MNQTHRKHFRLVEEFTHGTLLIQSAYAPQGQTPADGDWDTIPYEWDSPQETLRTLLSELNDVHQALATLADSKEGEAKAARHVEATMTRDRDELNSLKSRYNTLGTAYGKLQEGNETLSNTVDTLQAALTEANNQRNELRSQLVTAQKTADANPLYMSAMERDTLLRALDERLKGAHASETDKVNAIKIVRDHAEGMCLTRDQPVLLEAGNIVRVVLTERYQHEDRMFFVEKSTRDIANRLMKFIDAALA